MSLERFLLNFGDCGELHVGLSVKIWSTIGRGDND